MPSRMFLIKGKPIERPYPEPEHYHHLTLGDFDFPMSSDFRAWTYQECDEPDPGLDKPASTEEAPKVFYRYRPIDDEVDQLKSEVRGWRKKHTEMMLAIDKVQKPKPQGKVGYKGIR